MSPWKTTQKGSILSSVMLLTFLYAFINPGVNNLHDLSCALPRPALGFLPSTQPSCLFISPNNILWVSQFSIAKSGDTPHFWYLLILY